jgi:hypothetical protein
MPSVNKKFGKCVVCGVVSLDGVLCWRCAKTLDIMDDDAETLGEMENAGEGHVLSEFDARATLGLQLAE